MRLLHTTDLRVDEFFGSEIPPYAILSHTWGEEEVTLTEVENGTAENKKGFDKLRQSSRQAKADGYSYIWIDTCCIDKRSSAELSEAINSMYRWYQGAEVSYVYLADVQSGQNPKSRDSKFKKSRWFTRGWTLQELIAPSKVVFYSADWKFIGDKLNLGLEISYITNIDSDVLQGVIAPETLSISCRMSWAAGRKTTRVEDMSYCLLGLFDVNMPLLYGEGEKAFIRLQEAILKESDDQSLFAWCSSNPVPERQYIFLDWNRRHEIQAASAPREPLFGLLAMSPNQFSQSGYFTPVEPRTCIGDSESVISALPTALTGKGLRIGLQVEWHSETRGIALLACSSILPDTRVAILVRKLTKHPTANHYARVGAGAQVVIGNFGDAKLPAIEHVYIKQKPQLLDDFIEIQVEKFLSEECALVKAYPDRAWKPRLWIFGYPFCDFEDGIHKIGALQFSYGKRAMFIVILGYAYTRSPPSSSILWHALVTAAPEIDLKTIFDRYNPPSSQAIIDEESKRLEDPGFEVVPGTKLKTRIMVSVAPRGSMHGVLYLENPSDAQE